MSSTSQNITGSNFSIPLNLDSGSPQKDLFNVSSSGYFDLPPPPGGGFGSGVSPLFNRPVLDPLYFKIIVDSMNTSNFLSQNVLAFVKSFFISKAKGDLDVATSSFSFSKQMLTELHESAITFQRIHLFPVFEVRLDIDQVRRAADMGNIPELEYQLFGIEDLNVLNEERANFLQEIAIDAVEKGNIEVLLFLAERGFLLENVSGEQGNTLVHLAAQKKDLTVLELLIQIGMNLEMSNDLGQKPIHLAAQTGCFDAILLLGKEGVNLNALDLNRQTPMHLAARKGKVRGIQYLDYLGASMAEVDIEGKVPAYYAAVHSQRSALIYFATNALGIKTRLTGGKQDLLQVEFITYLISIGVDLKGIHLNQYRPGGPMSFYGYSVREDVGDLHALLLFIVANGGTKNRAFLERIAVDLNLLLTNGLRPIHEFAAVGNIEALHFLQENGVDPRSLDVHEMRPVDYAVRYGRVEVLEWLYGLGENFDSRESNGRDFILKILRGETEADHALCIKMLKFFNGIENFCRDSSDLNMQALSAIQRGELAVLQDLYHQGFELAAILGSRKDPFSFEHYAAALGKADIVRWLISLREGPWRAKRGETHPIYTAISHKQAEVVSNYLEGEVCFWHDEVILALKQGDPEIVRCMLENAPLAPPETWSDKDAYHALRSALVGQSLDTLRLLMDAGLDINQRDTLGRTILMSFGMGPVLAFHAFLPELIPFLVENGYDLDAVDNGGESLLHYAAEHNCVDLAKLLVRAGANINKQQVWDNRTPLVCAARRGSPEIVELLLQQAQENPEGHVSSFAKNSLYALFGINLRRGSDIHATYKDDRTVLMATVHQDFPACIKDSLDSEQLIKTIRLLLKEGADLSAVDMRGNTVLMHAARYGNSEIVRALLQELKKRNIDKQVLGEVNVDGKTARDLAQEAFWQALHYSPEDERSHHFGSFESLRLSAEFAKTIRLL